MVIRLKWSSTILKFDNLELLYLIAEQHDPEFQQRFGESFSQDFRISIQSPPQEFYNV